MNDKEKVLLGAACFFAGAVVGFLLAPVKKGIYCGNNSGNTYGPGEEETVKDELEDIKSDDKEEVFEVNKETEK
ncbi:hypothetical protein [Clostridium celatum]|uniref:Uncharacterized protein n=1 Tax=Clostridium celatum DSM 1785 TaxID=545697 RepID=L1QCW2_9CLOT|nr:hypothetical protein [Clostridium celatum]EKY25799.1 hypothetical protein HMPREF0216_02381 [Clostridium celatum DSM 1785]MCE9653675.1 hypothetical protein [Clostridium celatum]MDU2265391.1 hypothetical protein [Clostridium celatum]MDU6295023.1 hypothetical protein [Clostridium celatum]MDY3361330.1 hypothetical protein [Clostridium celatum]